MSTQSNAAIYPSLAENIQALEIQHINTERQQMLETISQYLQQQLQAGLPVRLNFICTHNSRRSHLAQCWAQALAYHFHITNVHCFSGGTKATALFPMVAKTLQDQGFSLSMLSMGDNPIYAIKYAPNEAPIIGFSKAYHHHCNPSSSFIAVMTCSEADEACPLVQGAEAKFALTYEDPKKHDGSEQMIEKYQERSLQIARELYYMFSKIQKQNER